MNTKKKALPRKAVGSRKSTIRKASAAANERTLAIDIGGTGLKAALLDNEGEMISERLRVATPPEASPELMVDTLAALVAPLAPYARVSVGFPGVVRRGK